jgi:hypothetical protein
MLPRSMFGYARARWHTPSFKSCDSRQIAYAIVTAYPDDVVSHVGGVVIPKPVSRGMLERWVAGLPAPQARKHESGR